MTTISPVEYLDFETWFVQKYPRLFEIWELDYSDMLDLDEWVEREYYKIINEWNRSRKTGGAL